MAVKQRRSEDAKKRVPGHYRSELNRAHLLRALAPSLLKLAQINQAAQNRSQEPNHQHRLGSRQAGTDQAM